MFLKIPKEKPLFYVKYKLSPEYEIASLEEKSTLRYCPLKKTHFRVSSKAGGGFLKSQIYYTPPTLAS